MAGTDVVDGDTLLLDNSLQSCYVSTGEVYHVDVVTYASAVVSVVVVTEHTELCTLTNGCLCDVGHEVVGDTIGVLTDGTALVCTDGVEVTEQHDVPLVVGLLDIHQYLLEH